MKRSSPFEPSMRNCVWLEQRCCSSWTQVENCLTPRSRLLDSKTIAEGLETCLNVEPINNPQHFLLEIRNKQTIYCFVCKILCNDWKECKNIHSCNRSHYGLHVNYFTLYHKFSALKSSKQALQERIVNAHRSIRRRKCWDMKNKCSLALEE